MEQNTERVNGKPLLQTFSELLNRAQLAVRLGTDTYGGSRDIYNALGYPKNLSTVDYMGRYTRQDIAKAIIDRPVRASWKGDIKIIETIKEEDTPFEMAWNEIYRNLQLKSVFLRADKLTGLGRYSILLLGLSDVSEKNDFKNPVINGTKDLKLLYIKPLSEKNAVIQTWVKKPNDPRFGLPETYTVQTFDGDTSQSFEVHYTRVIHLVEDITENEVYGTPRLQVVYNRLIDLEKVIGGDGEMFWRGARPGYTGEVDSDYQMSDKAYNDLQEQISEFENNLRRILVNQGVKYEALAQQIADPTSHVSVNIEMISAVTGIPKRILMGSERGELSSAQDKHEWIGYVTSRREEQNEPMILRPFIDRCIEIGVLPKPKTPYKVVWDKLFSLSDKEKAEFGKMRAEALKDYTTNGITQELIPIRLFAKFVLGLDDTQIEELMEYTNEQKAKEMAMTIVESEIMKRESRPQEQNQKPAPRDRKSK